MWYIMPPCLPWRYLLVLSSLVACLYNYQHSAVYRDSQVELVLNYQAVLLNWFWGLVAHFVSYKMIVISDKKKIKKTTTAMPIVRGASMMSLGTWKARSTKYQRFLNLSNVFMLIVSTVLLFTSGILIGFYHLTKVRFCWLFLFVLHF